MWTCLLFVVDCFKRKDAKTVNVHLKLSLRAGVKNKSLKQSKGTGTSGSFKIGEVVKPKKKPAAKPKKAVKPKAAKPKKAKTPTKKAAKPKAKKPAAAKKPVAKPAKKATKSPKKTKTVKPKKTPKKK